jgi:integrase
MATLALHTGMRLGEIFNLCGHDIDFTSGHILIRDPKNGHPRHIPMDSTARDLLSSYIPSCSSSHVFPSASGGRLSTVQKAFRNARIRAGMPDLHFHDLRHTFASHWVMSGGDVYVLKEILGHKSISMTQRYAHLSPAYKRTMVDRMEKMWGRPSNGTDASKPAEGAPEKDRRHECVTNPTVGAIGMAQDPLLARVCGNNWPGGPTD